MPRQLKPEYFKNRIEQSQIERAIIEAIQPGMYYHNIVCALANLLRHYTQQMVKDEVLGNAPGETIEGGDAMG